MIKKYSIAQGRANFSRLVREAEAGIRVELTRRGKPVAVLLGVEDFERLSDTGPSFWQAYQKFRRDHDLVELNIDPDEIWGDVRDPSLGRDFEW
jgi:prevent-host-death family protein